MMKIHDNIIAEDLFLYLKREKTLILSDLHMGYEEVLNKQGILIPKFQLRDLIKKIENILKKFEIKKVIINGDLKHEFGSASFQETKDISEILNLFLNYELIVIKGNHDKIISKKFKNLKLIDYYKINNILIIHGHEIPKKEILKDIETIIIGHEHPAISFKERPYERFKCFLKGKWKNKILIVMPSLNLVTQGIDITNEKTLSPFLQNDLSNFEVFIVEDKIFKFGKLKNLK